MCMCVCVYVLGRKCILEWFEGILFEIDIFVYRSRAGRLFTSITHRQNINNIGPLGYTFFLLQIFDRYERQVIGI